MKSINRNYCKGQVIVIFALSLIVLVGMVGLAIDSGRAYGVKAKLSAAVDAAAIAAARSLTVGATDNDRILNAKAAAQKFFNGNFPSNYLGVTSTTLTIPDPVHNSNGYWDVTVSATANMPTTFIRVLNWNQVNVDASGEARRRDVDLVLVLDTTGSLDPPTSPVGTFNAVKAAATNFVGKFIPTTDRVGLVTFAMGAKVDESIDKTSTRGFNKASITAKINALSAQGGTASAEGMRQGFNELNAVPTALRSSLRVIVFFSDGAPNGVPATFKRSSGATVTADFYAGPFGVDTPNSTFWAAPAGSSTNGDVYQWNQRNTAYSPNNFSDVPNLPLTSTSEQTTTPLTLTLTDVGGATLPKSIPLASYNNKRTLVVGTPYTNTRCNGNKAARNMLENIANTARDGATPVLEPQDVVVFSIGLGSSLNKLEVINCSYTSGPILPAGTCPTSAQCPECGCTIMKRVANANDSDTFNAAQPKGLFVYAGTASELDAAFSAIASDILRLTK